MLVTWVMLMLMRMLMLCHLLLLQFIPCSHSGSLLLVTLTLILLIFSNPWTLSFCRCNPGSTLTLRHMGNRWMIHFRPCSRVFSSRLTLVWITLVIMYITLCMTPWCKGWVICRQTFRTTSVPWMTNSLRCPLQSSINSYMISKLGFRTMSMLWTQPLEISEIIFIITIQLQLHHHSSVPLRHSILRRRLRMTRPFGIWCQRGRDLEEWCVIFRGRSLLFMHLELLHCTCMFNFGYAWTLVGL
jgi:hypothetical protein